MGAKKLTIETIHYSCTSGGLRLLGASQREFAGKAETSDAEAYRYVLFLALGWLGFLAALVPNAGNRLPAALTLPCAIRLGDSRALGA